MADPVAQNLLARLVDLHELLWARLTGHIELAAMGASDPESGHVTGSSNDGDRMDTLAAAVRHAEAERRRQMRNAREELRRTAQWYEERLGMRPPRRPRVESIDYLGSDGQRKLG